MRMLIWMTLLLTMPAMAQDKTGLVSLEIRTNAVCDMCKKTIETELIYEKGVKAVELDLEHNIIRVQIDPRRTDLEKVRRAITKVGYSADGLSPDMSARKRLPECCRKEDHLPQTAPDTLQERR